MSTKGEKRGFSGGMEHWVVCKVLKKNEYACAESVGSRCPRLSLRDLSIREPGWCIMGVFCGVPPCDCILDRNRRCRTRQELELLVPFHVLRERAAETASVLVLWPPRRRASSISRSSKVRSVTCKFSHTQEPSEQVVLCGLCGVLGELCGQNL